MQVEEITVVVYILEGSMPRTMIVVYAIDRVLVAGEGMQKLVRNAVEQQQQGYCNSKGSMQDTFQHFNYGNKGNHFL